MENFPASSYIEGYISVTLIWGFWQGDIIIKRDTNLKSVYKNIQVKD